MGITLLLSLRRREATEIKLDTSDWSCCVASNRWQKRLLCRRNVTSLLPQRSRHLPQPERRNIVGKKIFGWPQTLEPRVIHLDKTFFYLFEFGHLASMRSHFYQAKIKLLLNCLVAGFSPSCILLSHLYLEESARCFCLSWWSLCLIR